MILERIQLESWGCLRWPVELVLHPRVNLVHAPNESGKTTMVTALRFALLEPVTANVETFRPWESTVSPRAAVEFRTAQGHWKVEKVFGRRPQARLLRERLQAWEPVADEPDEVHTRSVELVTGAAVAQRRRGRESAESQRARQGVLYALWRAQGRPPLDDLYLPDAAERGLAEAVGVAVVSDRDRRIIEAATTRANQLLTPREKRETGRLAGTAAEMALDREAVRVREAKVLALREWEGRAESASALLEETEDRLREAQGEQQAAEAALLAAKDFAKKVEEAIGNLDRAVGDWSAWKKRMDDLMQVRQDLRTAEGEGDRKGAVLQARRDAAGAFRSKLEEAEGKREGIEEAARQAARAHALARARLDLARDLAEHAAIDARLGQAEPLEAEITTKLEERRGISVPDDNGLESLRQAERSLAVEGAKLDSARMRVSLTGERALSGRVILDGAEAPVDLTAGTPYEWEALERADLQLEGVGTLRVERALETSLTKQRNKVNELRKQLSEGLSAWGASSVRELEERVTQARACEEAVRQAQATLRGLLPDGRDAAEAQRAQVEARIRSIRERHTELSEEAPAVDTAEAAERDAARAAGEQGASLERLRSDIVSLRNQWREIEDGLPGLQTELREIEDRALQLAERIRLLEEDGLQDEQRQARLAELESAQNSAELELQRLQGEAPSVEDARQAYDGWTREADGLEKNRREVAGEATTARIRAAAIAEEGAYTEWVQAEEALLAASATYEALRLRADARNLLAGILVEERDRQRAELFRPVADRVSLLWSRVSDGRYAAVRMEDRLRPVSVVPRDYPSETPAPDALSGGAQEQMGTLVRLALAEVLVAADPEDGQTVVLDEPLAHSDPVRRRRVVELLSEPVPGLQIVILANDPRDYASLRRDGEIDLAGLLEQAREVAAAREP